MKYGGGDLIKHCLLRVAIQKRFSVTSLRFAEYLSVMLNNVRMCIILVLFLYKELVSVTLNMWLNVSVITATLH